MNCMDHTLQDPDVDGDATRAGRHLFSGMADFVLGAGDVRQLPESGRVEVCFAGRSNVGKSSLINALTGRRNLARTSNTPGRTRELNYYSLRETHCLVDLPGYGFARVSKRQRLQIGRLTRDYLKSRSTLRRAFLLVDARHEPKQVDLEMMAFLTTCAVPFQVVGTKADKVNSADVERSVAMIAEAAGTFPAALPRQIMTSARNGTGIELLRATIASLDWSQVA